MPALAPTVRSGDSATGKNCQTREAYLDGLPREGGKVAGNEGKSVAELLPNKLRFRAFRRASLRNVIFSQSPANHLWRLISE